MQLLTNSVLGNLLDQVTGNDFAFGLHPHTINDLLAPRPYWAALLENDHPHHHHLSRRHQQRNQGAVSTVGKDGFQVCMDVTQFKPNELQVKVVDKMIVVEGKHEERQDDHGYISRHFVRKYTLPQGYDPEKVVSTLSSDGVLTVAVPKPQLEDKSEGRVIQIQQTGPAHLNVKKNDQKEVSNGANGDAATNNTK